MDQRTAGPRRWYEVVGQALLDAARQYHDVGRDQRHGAGGAATS